MFTQGLYGVVQFDGYNDNENFVIIANLKALSKYSLYKLE